MIVSFYCGECKLDQDNEAHKGQNLLAEWFWARCRRCGRKLLRYITEKEKDPYYRNSLKVRRERDEQKRDLLQPGQFGFQTHFKKEYDKIEKAREDHEKEMIRRKAERDAYYKKFKTDISERQVVKKVLELEEEKFNG